MQFALPPRKTSRPPVYTPGGRNTRSSYFRRVRLRTVGWLLGGVACLFLLLRWARSGGDYDWTPPGTPPVVIVTVLDREQMSSQYMKMVEENRRGYASKHGYAVFLPNATDYNLKVANLQPLPPNTWSRIPAMRHAMTLYPHSTWYFYLDANAFFMKPRVSVQQQITSDHHLESLLIPDRSIVPPDSVIRTFKHKSASHVDLVMTQDHSSLSDDSFLVRRGPWAHFFLDSWYDPLYRSYNFQDAQAHALEHLVQWHVSVLSRLALVPQRVMNSYTHGEQDDEEKYHDGDFIANLHGCQADDTRDCDQEAKPFYEHFASILRSG